jgi:hypothetical protein
VWSTSKEEYKVNIRCFVVGDLAFEQKYLARGGGPYKTTRFCFMCGRKRIVPTSGKYESA